MEDKFDKIVKFAIGCFLLLVYFYFTIETGNEITIPSDAKLHLIPPEYSNFVHVSPKLIAVLKADKWGFIDREGKTVIPFEFDYLGIFIEGMAIIKKGNKVGCVDDKGTLYFSENLPPICEKILKGNKDNLDAVNILKKSVNTEQGNDNGAAIDLQHFGKVQNFSEGMSVVNIDGKFGFVNRKGQVVIPAKYQEVGNFSEGLARFMIIDEDYNSKWGFLNSKGDVVIDAVFEEAGDFRSGLAPVLLKVGNDIQRWGYINKTGKIVIQPLFSGAEEFSERYAAVCEYVKWGYINTSGALVIPYQFQEAGHYVNGWAKVKKDGKVGYINKAGRFVIAPQYDDMGNFREGFAKVKIAGKWGYIDKQGAVFIPPQFDEATDFSGGYAKVRNGDKWGFVTNEKVVIQPQFDEVKEFVEGIALVMNRATGIKKHLRVFDKWGYVIKKGIVIPPVFEEVSPFHDGIAEVKQKGKWGFIVQQNLLQKKLLPQYRKIH